MTLRSSPGTFKTLILPFALICSLIGCANDTVNPDPHQNVDETALSAIGALVAGSSTSEDVHGALGMLHWRLDGAEGRDDVYHTSGSVFDTIAP
ncbi:MAG: hypothetical protein IPM83_04350 [Ignavibacteria bacterium]|nr:hypothetical protein [Ignavibacteria bacterium]